MIQKGLFRLAILPGTLAGFYCNETTNGQYFSESAMADKDSPLLYHHHPNPPVPMYEHLHARYTTSWHEPIGLVGAHILTVGIDNDNPNQFNLTWSNTSSTIFLGIAQRHGDWLYGNYCEVAKAKE